MGDEICGAHAGLAFTTLVAEPCRLPPVARLGGTGNQLEPPQDNHIGAAA
jgi:hypothetical protein